MDSNTLVSEYVTLLIQARCNAATNADVFNSYSTAYDFQDVNETGFSPIVFVNETSIFRSNNNGPPTVERFAQV